MVEFRSENNSGLKKADTEKVENKVGGGAKIQEYLDRIKDGESKDEIFRDLPEVFKTAIENGLRESDVLKRQFEDKKRIEEIREKLGIVNGPERRIIETPYNKFSVANGETDTGVFWYQYRNAKAKELKESGQLEWGKERIYFDIKMQDMERLRDLAMRVAGENEIAIAFKHLDDAKTLPVQKDGKETRFVVNFASEDDAKKFLLAMKNSNEYSSFVSDRNMSHNGIRIDGIAEYASGFREGRSALERIMQGAFNQDKTKYSYRAESGREITISAEEYLVFKNQYEQFLKEMRDKEEQWKKLFI